MNENYIEQYKNKLNQEIEEREIILSRIGAFEENCELFLFNNNDFVPVDDSQDIINKVILTIANLEKSIKENQKDINNIKLSQSALAKVNSFSSEEIIKTLDDNISLIEMQNQNVEKEILSIKKPMDDFMKIKIDCPFCRDNKTCSHCGNTGKTTFKSLYFKKSNDELYSKNNNLAHSDNIESDLAEVYDVSDNIENNEKTYAKGRQTKFIITREN